ncbi:AMP-binding protein [soil metagenome]
MTALPLAATSRHSPSTFARGSAFSPADLEVHGARPALLSAEGVVTYAELASRVRATADWLGAERRLVLVTGENAVEPIVTYLAALTSGHPVLLAPGSDTLTLEALTADYDPDVVAGPVGGWHPIERRQESAHVLHPELAVLLSTSGSSGSPRLVRLSHDNVRANAESIAQYLEIRESDRAATTLPLHYCYGLSVLHSHLLRGAGVLLTDLSVVDPCFWELFRSHGITTLAGVPHTFELLDKVGFADFDLPSLRYVTQAGGRMAPERVASFAELGQRRGWDLFVMYGQTEATARMAYLPPELATEHPAAIGVPVPGGSIRVEPVPGYEEGVGELVYTGPNVMLGYAERPTDLAQGRTVLELRTGDLARRTPDGLFELVGRLSRFVKVLGLRVDLQRFEAALEGLSEPASCAEIDDELIVVVQGQPDTEKVRRHAAAAAGLPASCVRALMVDELPRLASGKLDHRAVTLLATKDRVTSAPTTPSEADTGADPSSETAVRALYAEVLEHPDTTGDDTFVGLGGDSLSYVEVAQRLEETLGHLPEDWHLLPIRDLARTARRHRNTWRRLETGVALRAAAIVAIVGSHVELFALLGGAHVLLGVAGYNVGRFHLTAAPPRQRRRHLLVSAARVAIPAMVWIAGAGWLIVDLGWINTALLNAVFGPDSWGPQWHYWFFETLVHTMLVLAALLSIPLLDRAERRHPFGFALGILSLALLARYGVAGVGDNADRIHTGYLLFWLFALGWATAKASTHRQRWVVTALVLITVPGFFADSQRDAVVVAGLLLLIWAPSVPCPAVLVRPVGVLASASLYIYLTHWQVYPYLEDDYPLAALLASLAIGIAYWLAYGRVVAWLRRSETP